MLSRIFFAFREFLRFLAKLDFFAKKNRQIEERHPVRVVVIFNAKNSVLFQGDSGSALQYAIDIGRWVQIGVVSFGPATGCQNDYPSGYSKIAHYLDWISQVTDIAWQ